VALLLIVPAAVALIAVVLGRAARDEAAGWASRRLIALAVAMTLFATVAAILSIEPDVPAGRAAGGVVISGICLGLLPVTVYYTVGYWVRPWWLLVPGLAALAVGTFFYLFFGLLIVADATVCTPDAHECPL
jgi:hypothetical protein